MALHRFVEADLNIDDILTTTIANDGELGWAQKLNQRLYDMQVRFRYGVLTRTVDAQLTTNPEAPLLFIPPGYEAWPHRVHISSQSSTGTGTYNIGTNASSYNNFNSSFHLNGLATDHSEVATVYPTSLSTPTSPQDLTVYMDGDDASANTLYIDRGTGGVASFRVAVLGWMHKKP